MVEAEPGRGFRVSNITPTYSSWQRKTIAAVDEMLRRHNVNRQRIGLILATTKADIDAEVDSTPRPPTRLM